MNSGLSSSRETAPEELTLIIDPPVEKNILAELLKARLLLPYKPINDNIVDDFGVTCEARSTVTTDEPVKTWTNDDEAEVEWTNPEEFTAIDWGVDQAPAAPTSVVLPFETTCTEPAESAAYTLPAESTASPPGLKDRVANVLTTRLPPAIFLITDPVPDSGFMLM
jgi:hypothetical protein